MGKLETNDSETGITLFCFTECMFWTHAKRRHTGSAVTQGTDEYNCPVWLSVYHLCVCPSVWQKPCVCVLLFNGLCTGSGCLSVLLSASSHLTTCRFTSIRSSVSMWTSGSTLHAVRQADELFAKRPAPPPPWRTRTLEDLLWSMAFFINLLYFTHLDQRPTLRGSIRGVHFRRNWCHYASIKRRLTFR